MDGSTDTSEFENVIVKTGTSGDVTRVRDVGWVELGAQTYSQVFSLNNKPATGIGVFQSPGANALEVQRAVEKKMQVLAKAFPQDVTYDTPFDTTKFVSESINEVYKTLIEAGLLVLVVILIFLQDWRAMLVPATTVPVTIIGAFAAMAALGFTINISTLFAIVLAIGIVVDDAIVVVEGAAHNIEKGMSGHDAAISAMDALFAPIIGITLVLISVFLPSAFLPGLTGQMYAQFALVIAATALLSAVNAATLKPTQCALWLRRPVPPEQRNFFYRGFNAVYNRVEAGYSRLIGRLVAHSNVSVICALILIAIGGYGLSRVPTGFIPIEDQGYLLVAVQLPDGAALERTQRVLTQVSEWPFDPALPFSLLDEGLPLALFPVRLEARFLPDGDPTEIVVRVFPDESTPTHTTPPSPRPSWCSRRATGTGSGASGATRRAWRRRGSGSPGSSGHTGPCMSRGPPGR